MHPRDSFNLGLNPWNVHTIGADVHKTGVKKEALRSVAIELSPRAEIKQMQIDFNERLVERADGKLAKVNGIERAMSIGGCSHLAAFCKAANKFCITPQQSLQDEDGKIDIAKLKKNLVMKELLEKGWTWQLVHWKAEELYPGLAAFLQRALNAGKEMTEFEVMLCMVEHAAQEDIEQVDWQKCMDIATIGSPRCIQYRVQLTHLVKNYGGGGVFHVIHELNSLDAKHCGSPMLGEEFWSAKG